MRQKTFYDYEGFVEKFEPKKTTDDCYTPPEVYDALRGWVDKHAMPLDGVEVVRPFRPGGDFEREAYPAGCLVLDNPPFSILSRILRWYLGRGVHFFLFAPGLTAGHYGKFPGVTVVAGGLNRLLDRVQDEARPDRSKRLVKYPPNVMTCALAGKLAVRGIDMVVPRAEAVKCSRLDCGQALFGGGWLMSERLAAERLAAERLAARECTYYPLSPREESLVRGLARDGGVESGGVPRP